MSVDSAWTGSHKHKTERQNGQILQEIRRFSAGVKELKGGRELSQMSVDSAWTRSHNRETERQKGHILQEIRRFSSGVKELKGGREVGS